MLKPHAERVVVCNTRGRGEGGNKSDRIDAERLSELLRVGSLKTVYHGASSLLTLKELVRSYTNLVEDGTRVMQRIKALFRARGIGTPGTSVYRQSTRKEWLAQLEERGARMRAEGLLEGVRRGQAFFSGERALAPFCGSTSRPTPYARCPHFQLVADDLLALATG